MRVATSLLTEFKILIQQMVTVTGPLIRNYFYSTLVVDSKSDATPVTLADKEAELKLREMISARFPDHGIIGEEYGRYQPLAEFQWVLDPVDGTKSFVAGAFDFGTIIGISYQGQPILGAIHHPLLNDLYLGDNETAYLNDKPIRVNSKAKLAETIVLASDLDNITKLQTKHGLQRLTAQTLFSRTWGNCFGYGLVAGGLAAVMIDPRAAIWDSMGIIPIIRGAGGIITDFHGNDPVDAGSAIACAPQLHAQVIALLNKHD
jgi:histidinol phosphatase-like enzyme (inositol monophosphatase family)